MNVPKYKYLTYWLSYFFFLLVLTSSVQAQSGRASYQDSLIRLLQNTADPIRKAGIFSVLAKYSYENKKYETSIGYANDAIALQNNQTPKLVIP